VIGLLIAALLLLATALASYNTLVRWRNFYQNAFAQIDVQLRRRYDLIPNLVESARAYLAHERGTLEAVIAARTRAAAAASMARTSPGDPGAMRGLAGAESTLGTALGRLFAVAESYPALRADRTIAALMEELTATENRVGFARQAFNDAVTSYNNARETFPAVLLASILGFAPAQLLESTTGAAEREPPRMNL